MLKEKSGEIRGDLEPARHRACLAGPERLRKLQGTTHRYKRSSAVAAFNCLKKRRMF
ncbi:hypothetical protein LP415_15965 [Polaromonas sp. P1(28)-8]|nr:hypothetical protein LP415_15965 [Polaromonas sp. P1(28)-8]